MGNTLALGQWIMVYVMYSLTSGGYGVSMLFVDGIYQVFASYNDVAGAKVFSALDTVKFSGGFTGQLRRMQIYSPAAFSLITGTRKRFFFGKENIYFCNRNM